MLHLGRQFSSIYAHIRPYIARMGMGVLSSIVSVGSTLAFGYSIGHMVDNNKVPDLSLLSMDPSVMFLLIITVIMCTSSFVRIYFIGTCADKVVHSIRTKLYSHAMKLAPDFFENGMGDEVASLITGEISVLQSIISGSFNHFLRSTLTLIGSIIMLFWSNSMLAVYTASILTLALAPVLYVGKKVRISSKTARGLFEQLSMLAFEKCKNILIVQSFAQERREQLTFRKKSEFCLRAFMTNSLLRSFFVSLIIGMVMLSISCVLWIGLHSVHTGEITPGSFISFIFYAFTAVSSIGHMGDLTSDMQKASSVIGKINDFLAIKPKITDIENPIIVTKQETDIEFKNVYFSYSAMKSALKGVSFRIQKGKVFAIVGRSGSGKSTLLKLLMRFHDTDSGSILINGIDIKNIKLESLRSLFGFVPQTYSLFSCSIAENISYGSPESSRDEIKLAADLAHCTEFIEKLPHKFDSIIGNDNLNLSGGQVQRILIARAILKNPQILILDEATSSLDSESDYLVRSALSNLMKDRTTIVIAHRLSTVSGADNIMLLNDGEVSAIGSHEQLLESSAIYKTLVEMQFKKNLVSGQVNT